MLWKICNLIDLIKHQKLVSFPDFSLSKLNHCFFCKLRSETAFSGNRYHIETSQLIRNANQSTGFHRIHVFTERCFRIDISISLSLKRFQDYFRQFGILSTNSFLIATSDRLSTTSLCECKIASVLKRFCIILDRSQVLTRLAKGKDLSGVALVAPLVSTIFIMVITLLMITRSWEKIFNFYTISSKWTVSKGSTMVQRINSSLGNNSTAQANIKSPYSF